MIGAMFESSSSSSSDDDEYLWFLAEENKNKYNSGVVFDFLESSSSSSDDDVLATLKRSRPRVRDYVRKTVHYYTDEEFKQTFRVGRAMATRLMQEYKRSEFHPPGMGLHGGSEYKSAEEDVLSFLWFAGNKCCLRDVAERFGTGLATCFRQHIRIMNFLLRIAPNVIKFPDNKEEAAAKFEQISGFPNVIGCIDGSHIPIRTPAGKLKHTYVNRHDWPSLTLQAICDSDRKFIDVFTGVPGKMHDARILNFSDINPDLPEICGERYHLLGDGAYALRTWLLVPYKDFGNMTEEERRFNCKFSATRVLIENAFALLKGRFRQLALLIDMHTVEKMSTFIISCCTLHNLCIDHGDEYNFLVAANDAVGPIAPPQNNVAEVADIALRRAGVQKREQIKHSFL